MNAGIISSTHLSPTGFAMATRWWPDRRPPRSGAAVPAARNIGLADRQIPNPASGDPLPPRRERGFWAPQQGKIVRGRYVPARAEPPGWQEPRKKLQFPKATPQVQRSIFAFADFSDENAGQGRPPVKEEQYVNHQAKSYVPSQGGVARAPLGAWNHQQNHAPPKQKAANPSVAAAQQQLRRPAPAVTNVPAYVQPGGVGLRPVGQPLRARTDGRAAPPPPPKEEPACIIS